MTTHMFEHRAAPPRNRLAWFASLAVHAGLLALLGYVSWTTFRGGRPQSPSAESGFVLGLADGDVREPPRGDGSTGDGASEGLGSGGELAAEAAAARLVPLADGGTEPLAPAPRLPLLALGGGSPGANASTRPTTAGRPRLNDLIERATVHVFGAVGEGSRFVYVFDRSTSMRGGPLAAAKQQLIASLDALSSVHQFQVIFFNHQVQAWDHTGGQRRIPFASDANKALAVEFIERVTADGATERSAPLLRAIALNPDAIFFLTDADDRMSPIEQMDVTERAQRDGTEITCIEFGDGPRSQSQNFLTTIAAETGGDYVYVDVTKLAATR